MKTKMAVAAVLAAACITGCDGAPNFSGQELVSPDQGYEIDTWGNNSEVYEFTPKGNSGYVCVVYILDNLKATGLSCFPKGGSPKTAKAPWGSSFWSRG